MERLMLLDGFGLVYRGYYALPPLTTSRGELVNGVFGFCSIVLRGFQDLKPDYVAVAFDLSGPTFRHEQFADYKATRTRMPDDLRDQFPKVREVVKGLNRQIAEWRRLPTGPPVYVRLVDEEAMVARWREARRRLPSPAPPARPHPDPPPRRSRWWRRRSL